MPLFVKGKVSEFELESTVLLTDAQQKIINGCFEHSEAVRLLNDGVGHLVVNYLSSEYFAELSAFVSGENNFSVSYKIYHGDFWGKDESTGGLTQARQAANSILISVRSDLSVGISYSISLKDRTQEQLEAYGIPKEKYENLYAKPTPHASTGDMMGIFEEEFNTVEPKGSILVTHDQFSAAEPDFDYGVITEQLVKLRDLGAKIDPDITKQFALPDGMVK